MKQYNGTEIAIIGMSFEVPGASDASEFWENLKSGNETITRYSKEELLAAGVPADRVNDPDYVRARGELEGAPYFDAPFFGFRPVEAKVMDPQMRVFYQHCWKAVEEAGYDLTTYKEKIGLFSGAAPNNNWENSVILNKEDAEVDDVTSSQLRNVNYMSTRISHKFDLTGPSVYLNSTCSTALVAIQRACMSLLLRECNMSLAGGVYITNLPDRGYKYHEGFIFSDDGYCRAFDEKASGTVSGEGVGVVLLKRLDEAIKDGDPIHAVIKGSGINNDGSNKASYTAPGSEGQQEVILKALKMAKVPKESIGYIEAHGTGTALGDVIEMDALSRVYGESKQPYCAVGSVKTNIGHLISASGVAGMIKAILAMKHKQIPPTLNIEKVNPKFKLEGSPFYFNDQLQDWNPTDTPRRAGVSSFGIGGTNAHVILEEWLAPEQPRQAGKHELFVFSAKSESALNNNMRSFKKFLSENPDTNLSDAAYTLQHGRATFDYRRTLVASSVREAIVKLRTPDNLMFTKTASGLERPLVFMFSGQGSQYAGMGKALKQFPVFQSVVANCLRLLESYTGKDFARVWEDEDAIHHTENCQPLLFVLEYAIAKLLIDFGYSPDLLVGHSIGEYTAACISGMISLEDALRLVVKRGELMQQAQPGDMMSVSLSRKEMLPHLKGHSDLKLTASNSSELCVVAGTPEAIATLKFELESKDIRAKLLVTSHAFHSEMMRPAVSPFFHEAKNVKFQTGRIPVLSSKTGQLVTSEMLDPGYWSDQIIDEVQFSQALEYLYEGDNAILLEVGPGSALATFARTHKNRNAQPVYATVPKHNDDTSASSYFLQTIGKLWENNNHPNWQRIYGEEPRQRIHLSTYQFDKIPFPHIVDAEKTVRNLILGSKGISNDVSDWLHQPSWEVVSPVSEVSDELPMLFFQVDAVRKDSLKALFPNATFIHFGDGFVQLNEHEYQINGGSEADFQQLFEALNLKGEVRLAYFLSNKENSETDTVISHNYRSLIYLTKALGNTPQLTHVGLLMVSFGAHQIGNSDDVDPFLSLAIGACKVIDKEYHDIQARAVDFSANDDLWSVQLKSEIHGEESTVAYRMGLRFSQSYKRAAVKTLEKNQNIKNGATYLITGGTGGIGLALAGRMAQEFEGLTFIMLGRRELPAKTSWRDSKHEVASKFSKMEDSGATVHYFSVDLADKEAVNRIWPQLTKIGKIDGVIHAAGTVDKGGIIQNRRPEADENLFATKVHGTIHLLNTLDVDHMDFFLLCSSSAAVKAPAGEVAYVATNNFLNSLSMRYPNVRSMGWNAWSESGMAVDVGMVNQQNSLTDEQGYALFKKALVAQQKHLVVSSFDLEDEPDHGHSANEESSLEKEDSANREEDTVEKRLVRLWSTFFGRSDISPLENFFEIGGDSLKALTMINWIKEEFGIIITVQSFFDYDNIRSLTNYLEISLADQKESTDSYEVIDI